MKYIRATTFLGFEETALAVGLDPEALLRAAGLQPKDIRNEKNRISINAAAAIFHHAALASGCEDFALRVSRHRKLSVLGPLAMLTYVEPTVREAVAAVLRYQAMHTNAVHAHLVEQDGLAYLGCHVDLERNVPGRQAHELTIATINKILSVLLGPAWRPLQVCFRHGPPRVQTLHSAVFRTDVEFNSGADCVILRSSDLDREISTADPQLARNVRDYLSTLELPAQASLRFEVRQVVEILIVSGNCTAEAVAQRLGLPVRTFYLRLKQDDASFAAIVNDVRKEIAVRKLETADASMSEISGILGFSSLPAFSRWFRQHFGCTARDWVADQASVRNR
ncbi:AraC family transcriptional regulator [Pseudoduganella sp. OTU4001]|uniref:AraC family transcriptional regulator n=1 Tax=Pseudoduganella sp. OTU4001 TaxID=3043854 RepID=UPI00313E1F92